MNDNKYSSVPHLKKKFQQTLNKNLMIKACFSSISTKLKYDQKSRRRLPSPGLETT